MGAIQIEDLEAREFQLVETLRARFPGLAAPRARLVLVVGSQSSSNSNRLVEVARREGAAGHLVESAQAVEREWLAGIDTLGVTAGASTPEAPVVGVLERLAELAVGELQVEELPAADEGVVFALPALLR